MKWVEDGQQCRLGLGLCVRAGEAGAVGARADVSVPNPPQVDLLRPQGEQNCFLAVRNRKRFEMDFNLGT